MVTVSTDRANSKSDRSSPVDSRSHFSNGKPIGVLGGVTDDRTLAFLHSIMIPSVMNVFDRPESFSTDVKIYGDGLSILSRS
jgi:hypothetical protein